MLTKTLYNWLEKQNIISRDSASNQETNDFDMQLHLGPFKIKNGLQANRKLNRFAIIFFYCFVKNKTTENII